MLNEILFCLYLLVGILVFSIYKRDVKEHADRVASSRFMKRVLYIIVFLASMIAWPLLIGA